MIHTDFVKKARARGSPAQMYTRSGGLAGIKFCGCTAKVRCLIFRGSPQLIVIPRIDRRVLSWLRKVGINVSAFVGYTGTGVDSCSASTIEHLKNTLRDEEVVVFFYCDFRSERSASPAEVMRSLLFQLLRHFLMAVLTLGTS